MIIDGEEIPHRNASGKLHSEWRHVTQPACSDCIHSSVEEEIIRGAYYATQVCNNGYGVLYRMDPKCCPIVRANELLTSVRR